MPPDAPVDTATDAWPALIWIAGAMAVLARLASGFTRRAALARTCTPVDRGPLADTVERYRLAMGIRRRVQVREGRPQRAPYRCVPSGQGDRRKVAHSLDRLEATEQQLAAPDRAVGSVARAVEGEPQDGLARRPAVLGQQ